MKPNIQIYEVRVFPNIIFGYSKDDTIHTVVGNRPTTWTQTPDTYFKSRGQ